MKKYKVEFTGFLIVEAESEEEAIRRADNCEDIYSEMEYTECYEFNGGERSDIE